MLFLQGIMWTITCAVTSICHVSLLYGDIDITVASTVKQDTKQKIGI